MHVSWQFGVLCAVLLLQQAVAAAFMQKDVIHPDVHRSLRECGRANVIVSLTDAWPDHLFDVKSSSHRQMSAVPSKKKAACINKTPATPATTAAPSSSPVPSTTRVNQVVDRLQLFAQEHHAPVLKLVETHQDPTIHAKSLWISNQIVIRNATQEFLNTLQASNNTHIRSIRPDRAIAFLPELMVDNTTTNHRRLAGDGKVSWGVERIQAPSVWKEGFTGKNVIVGSIDSGVRVSHSILKTSYFGPEGGWLDTPPVDDETASLATEPTDDFGHGTSSMALIVGADGYGVAPGAKWRTCRACDTSSGCEESRINTCAEFLICPDHNKKKDGGRCEHSVQIVNLSFNSGKEEDPDSRFFEPILKVLTSVNIIPVMASGNSGPGCKSVEAPAEWSTPEQGITVGATTETDGLASFSGRGPGLDGQVKPDLSAPGQAIPAALFSDDTAFSVFKGTSVAAPHVTGAIALLLEAFPTLGLAEVRDALMQSADTDGLDPVAAKQCAVSETDPLFPNNSFGHGRLNVWRALEWLRARHH